MPTATPVKNRHRIPVGKRVFFSAIVVFLLVVSCELISFTVLLVVGQDIALTEVRRRQAAVASGTTVSAGASETIHPYLGWVHNPQISLPEVFEGREVSVNKLGFKDESESIYRRSSDIFIVGIAGGSVAHQFSWEAESLLKEKLSAHPAVKGRRIQFVRLALPGYKQPQQLMALSYLLSLGAEFDVLINIDGYNEAALTMGENVAVHTATVYPRAWHARSIMIVDPRDSADSLRLLQLRGGRQRRARSIISSRLWWSPTCNMIWHFQDTSEFAELTELGIQVSKNRSAGFIHHGPKNEFTGEALLDEVAAIWKRSSLQIHHICSGNNTVYLHVLQPNQYVPNSKPMSQAEQKQCISESPECGGAIPPIYPRLVKCGTELAQSGVEFSDQTMVFSTVDEPLYVDAWCHFNRQGNILFANAVAERLLPLLDRL